MTRTHAVAACLLGLWAAQVHLTWSSSVDDAWISARYAEHIAAGLGPTFSTDGPAVEGFTNPAWVVMLAVASAFQVDLPTFLPWAGAASGLAAIFAATSLTWQLTGCRIRSGCVMAALCFDPHLAISATNGLESAAYAAALAWGATALIRPGSTAFRAGLAATLRPEGVVLAGLVALDALRRRRWRAAASACALPAAIGVWRLATYGTWVPNTFVAKTIDPLLDRWRVTANLMGPWEVAWWTALFAVALLGLFHPRTRLLGLGAVGLALPTLSVMEWMPAGRLYLPLLVLGVPVFGALAPRWAAFVTLLPLLWAVAPPGQALRRYDARHSVVLPNDLARSGEWLAEHLPPGSRLWTRDAGVLAWSVGPSVAVVELHEDALTRLHPGGASFTPAVVPTNPEVLAQTVQRVDAPGSRYGNDRVAGQLLTVPYAYIGRVHQHEDRYVDVYVRADLALPEAPPAWITHRKGPHSPVGSRQRASRSLPPSPSRE